MTTKGSNQSSAMASYIQRSAYRDFAWMPKSNIPTPMDLSYEKTFYGRLDTQGNSVIISNDNLKRLNARGENIFALNFVADAFQDLKNYYSTAVNTRKISSENSNLVVIGAKEGWVDINKEYQKYITLIFDSFNKAFLGSENRDDNISSFRDFMGYFAQFLTTSLMSFPITKTGFIASRWCPPRASGLMIKIMDEDGGDDQKKFNKVINDPNFNFFVLTAQRYGFKVNKNLPWQLIADLGSPVMKKYMENYPPVPQATPPLIQEFYESDIVEVTNIYADPTTVIPPNWGESAEPPILKFRVREVDMTNGIAFLSPAPGYEYQGVNGHPSASGQMFIDLQKNGISMESEYLELITGGAKRNSYPQRLSDYKKTIREWKAVPKITINNLFDRYYHKTYISDVKDLINLAVNFYNVYVNANPTKKNDEFCTFAGKTKRTTKRRLPVSKQQAMQILNKDSWLNFYATIRILESKWVATRSESTDYYKKIETLNKYQNPSAALEFINMKTRGNYKLGMGLTPGIKYDSIEDMLSPSNDDT